jgi:hypothetical protein
VWEAVSEILVAVGGNSRFVLLIITGVLVLAHAVPAEAKHSPLELPGFTIPATNGFVVHVTGDQDGWVTMRARRGNASGGVEEVAYSTKGVVTEKTIRANFHKFGKVTVRFKGSGRVLRTKAQVCNLPSHKPVKTRLGVFRGRIRFRGQGGFTRAAASRAKAAPALLHTPPCSAFPPPDDSGASLITAYHAFYGSSFYAYKATSASPTFLEAYTTSNRRKVVVERFVTALGGPDAFTYEPGYSLADVTNLPAPFQGSAHFTKSGRNTYSTGTLSAAFPVGGSAPFAGQGFTAVLYPSAISVF